MLVALTIILLFLLLLGYGGVAFPALFLAALFVGFWLVVIRAFIGLSRWIIGCTSERREGACARRGQTVSTGTRRCTNPHCGRFNLAAARFCGQCGRPLR